MPFSVNCTEFFGSIFVRAIFNQLTLRVFHLLHRNIFGDRRLQNNKNKIFAYQKEYYIEYENLENLRYLFYNDMVSYFIKEGNK